MLNALSGELAPPRLDVGPVVLVVTGHVEDAVRASPALGDVDDPAGVHRGEVAGKDDELGAGGEWGGGVSVALDVKVGENLNAHYALM